MKPYNERLPLIDAAIDYHKSWPKHNLWSLVKIQDNGRWLYAFTDYTITGGKFICTRDEFNERKRERQNKPDWADAPEWADYIAQDRSGIWSGFYLKPVPTHSDGTGMSYWASGHDSVFMDKGEVIGNWQDTLEKRPEPKEQDMNNDWYEKGELPPEGIDCEVYYANQWVRCTTRININGHLVFTLHNDDEPLSSAAPERFLPLRNETDKLVEQVFQVIYDKDDYRTAAEELAKQGYRKIKPMSKEEFIAQIRIGFDVDEEFCGEIYDAGCRFLDQGETK